MDALHEFQKNVDEYGVADVTREIMHAAGVDIDAYHDVEDWRDVVDAVNIMLCAYLDMAASLSDRHGD